MYFGFQHRPHISLYLNVARCITPILSLHNKHFNHFVFNVCFERYSISLWRYFKSCTCMSAFLKLIFFKFWKICYTLIVKGIFKMVSRGEGTQYKCGYMDVPQTWVSKSSRQVCQWIPFHYKIWYFHGCNFQMFPKFAQIWEFFQKICKYAPWNGANFEKTIFLL